MVRSEQLHVSSGLKYVLDCANGLHVPAIEPAREYILCGPTVRQSSVSLSFIVLPLPGEVIDHHEL